MVPDTGCVKMANRHRVLAGTFVANVGQIGTRTVISPLVPLIVEGFAISTAGVGTALTLMTAAYAIGMYPSGGVSDRFGERSVITGVLAVAAFAGSMIALAPTFPVFTAGVVILGIGTGFYVAGASSILDRRFDRTGRAFGIHVSGGPLAGALLPVVATWVATRWGWRAGVLVGTATALLGLFAFRLLVPSTDPAAPVGALDRLRPRAALATLKQPSVAGALAVGCVGAFVYNAFFSFFPTFLQQYGGYTPEFASASFGAIFFLMIIGAPTAGLVADRYGSAFGVALPMVLTACGLLALVYRPGLALPGVVLLGAGLTWGGSLQSALMNTVDEDGGSGFAMASSTYILIGSSGSIVTGWLATEAGWGVAYAVSAALCLLTAAAILGNRWIRHPRYTRF
jgi:YNFM family putative membrane transporter